jgi:hypothetical protein
MMSFSFRTTYLCALLALTLHATSTTAQPRANLFFTSTINQPADGQLTVRLFVQADQENFQLGSASFVFDFNIAGLSFPSGSNAASGTDYSFSDPLISFPYNSLVTQPITGKVQVEVTYAYSFIGACQGAAVTTTATREIAEVIFTIEDPSATAGLMWDASLTRVFDDGSLASPNPPTTCDTATDVEATEIVLGTLLGDDAFLPVELTMFEAQADGRDVVLTWATASETNNAGFTVERRAGATSDAELEAVDAAQWSEVAWVEGAGTTEEAQTYTHRLTGLEPGRHVFRLKQIDYDGTFAYSPEIEVTVELAKRFALSAAYPNPFNPQTSFSLAVAQTQEVSVEVYNVLGRRVDVLHQGMMEAKQARSFVWEASSHPSGLYFIRVVGEQFVETRRVTLIK